MSGLMIFIHSRGLELLAPSSEGVVEEGTIHKGGYDQLSFIVSFMKPAAAAPILLNGYVEDPAQLDGSPPVHQEGIQHLD